MFKLNCGCILQNNRQIIGNEEQRALFLFLSVSLSLSVFLSLSLCVCLSLFTCFYSGFVHIVNSVSLHLGGMTTAHLLINIWDIYSVSIMIIMKHICEHKRETIALILLSSWQYLKRLLQHFFITLHFRTVLLNDLVISLWCSKPPQLCRVVCETPTQITHRRGWG